MFYDNEQFIQVPILQPLTRWLHDCSIVIVPMVFDTSLQPYIAEISFISNSARQCTMPIGELPNTVVDTVGVHENAWGFNLKPSAPDE